MTTIGVVLSGCSLAVALLELRYRSDFNSRRIAAICATAAWATMGFVALDESRKCDVLQRQESIRTSVMRADNIWLGSNPPLWTYKTPDGGTIEYNRGGVESRLANNGERF